MTNGTFVVGHGYLVICMGARISQHPLHSENIVQKEAFVIQILKNSSLRFLSMFACSVFSIIMSIIPVLAQSCVLASAHRHCINI